MTGRWRLPGPGRLVTELADVLSGGRSAVLLVPDAPVIEGLELVLSRVVNRPWRRVELAEIVERPGSLAERLHDQLGLGGNTLGADAASLVEASELRGHALWVVPAGGSPNEAGALAALLRDFSRSAATRPVQERPVLMCCARLRDLDPLPVSEAALHRAWWWGRVGPLDTRVVVDGAMGYPRVIGDIDVVSEVSTYDLDLADQLARSYTGDLDVDLGSLVDTGSFAAWLDVAETIRSMGEQVVDEPPHDLRTAWSAGAVDWWGDPKALQDLVWRGQVGAVMPFVEIGRQRLAHWVHHRKDLLGGGWEQRDLLALEAGQLHKVIRDHEKLRRASTVYQFATAIRDARHSLAHLEPLDRDWLRRHERLIRATTF
jgi:hypothetical protein